MTLCRRQRARLASRLSSDTGASIALGSVPFSAGLASSRRTCFNRFTISRYFLFKYDFIMYLLSKEWNGSFFEKVFLKDLGQQYQLGHGGFPCPCPKPGPLAFVVFHTSGVFPVDVAFCDCVSPPAPSRRVQLLRARWFLASCDRPQTVFTFDVLNMFHKLTLQAKTTLYDYYHSILNLSDNLQLAKPMVQSSAPF